MLICATVYYYSLNAKDTKIDDSLSATIKPDNHSIVDSALVDKPSVDSKDHKVDDNSPAKINADNSSKGDLTPVDTKIDPKQVYTLPTNTTDSKAKDDDKKQADRLQQFSWENTINLDQVLNTLKVNGLIPQIIHQSWKTTDLPPKFANWSETWKETHPGWVYLLWTDQDNRLLVERYYPHLLKFYDELPRNILRVDFVRFLYLDKLYFFFVKLVAAFMLI